MLEHIRDFMETSAAAVAATGMGLGFMSLFVILWIVILAVAILGFALWIWALVDSLNRKYKHHDNRILWVLVVVFAGLIGAIVYYFCVVRNPKNW